MRLFALAAAAAVLAPALATAQTVPAMPTLDETPAQRTARHTGLPVLSLSASMRLICWRL